MTSTFELRDCAGFAGAAFLVSARVHCLRTHQLSTLSSTRIAPYPRNVLGYMGMILRHVQDNQSKKETG
jgi:hypothetical protein